MLKFCFAGSKYLLPVFKLVAKIRDQITALLLPIFVIVIFIVIFIIDNAFDLMDRVHVSGKCQGN